MKTSRLKEQFPDTHMETMLLIQTLRTRPEETALHTIPYLLERLIGAAEELYDKGYSAGLGDGYSNGIAEGNIN